MANGFKVAEAYADFRFEVDKAIGDAMAKLKASGNKFDRMGRDAGESYSRGFRSGIDLTKGFEAEAKKVQTRSNQIQRLGNQAGEGYSRGFTSGINLRSAMVEQIGVVKSSRPAFGLEGKQAGQAYARGFNGQHVSGPSIGGGGAGAAGEAAGQAYARGLSNGARKGSKGAEDSLSKVADRTQAKFSALKFLALSQGLPAAAAVGAAATTAIVAGAGALFIGLGVSGALGAEQVSRAWTGTLNTVTHGITNLSAIYEGPLTNAADMVGAAFMRSGGLIQRGMVNSVGGVESLTASALNLAENALPGIVTASGRLGPVLEGVHNLTADVGLGFGEMAANASEGSVGASRGLTILGDTLRTTEARVGTIAANFANASSGPLNSFRYTVDQITGALVDVSAKGSAANGFLSGFTTSTSGTVTVLRGMLTAVNALPPQVAQLGGAVASTSMIMSKLGVDAGAGWDGLGAKIKGAGNELKGTEKFAAKAGTAVGGLAAGALNPAALAVGALSIGLLLLGERQEKAAQAAAEHRENVRTLTDAIRQDNGEISEATATANTHALAQKNAADNIKLSGVTLAQATVAANGNSVAMRDVTQQTNGWIQGLADSGVIAQKSANSLKGINQGLLENGGSWDTASGAAYGFTESMAAMHPEQMKQLQALFNGTGAIGEQAKATREAYTSYLLQEQGLTGLTEAQVKARDATTDHTKAIYEQQNASLGYRGAVQSTKEAMDGYNAAMKDGKISGDDDTRAVLALENAMSQQEQAAYNAAYANSTARTENDKQAEATRALNRETVNLANSFTGPLPASLAATVGKMSVTEAQAAGLRVRINAVGQAVYTLPNGKDVVLTGDNKQAMDAIYAVQQALAAVRDKKVTLEMNTTYTYTGTSRGPNAASPTASARFSADGNLFKFGAQKHAMAFADGGTFTPMGMTPSVVPANTQRIVGDNPSVPESYIPHKPKDARAQDILSSTNKAFGVTVQAPAPSITNHYHITAPPTTDLEQLAAAVSRKIMLRGK